MSPEHREEMIPLEAVCSANGLWPTLHRLQRLAQELPAQCFFNTKAEIADGVNELERLIRHCQTLIAQTADTDTQAQLENVLPEPLGTPCITPDTLSATLGYSATARETINALWGNEYFTEALVLKPEIIAACMSCETLKEFKLRILPTYQTNRLTDATYGLLRTAILRIQDRYTNYTQPVDVAAEDGAYI